MKQKLLFVALAAVASGAFAQSAHMDLTIPGGSAANTTSAPPATRVVSSTQPTAIATTSAQAPVAGIEKTTPVQPVMARSSGATQTPDVKTGGPARQGVRAEKSPLASTPAAAVSTTASKLDSAALPASAQAALAASTAVSGDAPTPGVNPFTGKSLSEEDLQRQLEASKARTALLEEQLKQATISADIANLPIKKRAEVSKLELPAPPAAASAPVVPKPVKVKKVVVKKTPLVEVVAPQTPHVRLDGVVVNEGVASAILDVDGNSSVVANGGATPFGQVRVLNANSVMVGAMALHVEEDSTIARVRISDPKWVDPKDQKVVLPTLPMASGVAATANGRPLPPVPLPPPTTAMAH